MINAEADVFDYVYQSVSSAVPEGCFSNEYVPVINQLPYATLMEIDNTTDTRHRSTAPNEEFAVVTYEANSYAHTKDECRTVMNAIDDAIVRLGFTRLSMQYVPNLADRTLHRMTARYRATIGADLIVYRRN